MFVKDARTWFLASGEQRARGLFLILMQPEDERPRRNNVRAILRSVELRQLGHFMMGIVKIGPHEVSVSGSYGGDGLPCDVPRPLWEHGVPLPDELYDAWKRGGGWNSAESEAQAMRDWALANEKALRKPFK